MANIDIKEKWFTDPRRLKLIRLCKGNEFEADGMAIWLWRLGQQYLKNGRSLIPIEILDLDTEAKSKLTEAKLIKTEANSYYVVGSQEYLSWLEKRRDAGRAGGSSKSSSKLKTLKQYRSKTEAPNPSPIPNLIPIPNGLTSPDQSQGVTERRGLLRFWLEEYQRAKGIPYAESKSARVNSQIKNLHQRLGVAEAKRLMGAYLKINKPFYISRGHDLGTLQSDLVGVSSWAATPIKNFKEAKEFQTVQKVVEEESVGLHERVQIRQRLQNPEISGAVFQSLQGASHRQIPGSTSESFDSEFLTGRGNDDIADCS